jgi:integrase
LPLTVPALDLLRRDLRVERQLVRRRGEGVVLTPRLKTETSYRNVPLAAVVVDVVAAHLARWRAHADFGLVFTNERGAPIQQYPFGQAWATARKRAKLPTWVNGPHQLRHHYASLLIASGSSVKVVQRRLRHASAKTTLDIYGHMFPDDEDATRAAIEAPLAAALGQKPRAVAGS